MLRSHFRRGSVVSCSAVLIWIAHASALQFPWPRPSPSPSGTPSPSPAAPSSFNVSDTPPSPSPAVETAFPTASEPCYVCGDSSLSVQPGLTTTFGGEEYSCGDLELAGQLRLFGEDTCPLVTLLATSDCNCSPDGVPSPAPSPAPSQSPLETPFPTASEICYVCGDSSLSVQPGLTTTFGGEEYSCGDLELTGQLRFFGEDTCPVVTLLATSDCGCTSDDPTEAPVSAPTTPDASAPTISSPTVDAPVAVPTPLPPPPTPRGFTEAPVESVVDKSSGGGGGALYALAALALLPIGAGLFVYCKREDTAGGSKKQNPVRNPSASEVEEGNGPNAPANAQTSAPYHRPADPSDTASLRTDDEHPYHAPPVAVASIVSQSTLSEWSGAGSTPSQNDHLHRSVGEASAGSGQSHDPPASSTSKKTAPYASPPASLQSAGNYLPDVKDQCRSLAAETGEAIVVSDAVPVASEQDDRKRPPIDP